MQRDLVERAMAGDHDAFEELTRVAIRRLFVVARLILRDDLKAEDATQEALTAAWRRLPRLRDPDRFGPWLHRLLVNACYEELRRHRRWSARLRTLPVDGPSIPDSTLTIDDRDAIDRAFARLTPQHRAVVVLHLYAGLPLTEVADVVGVPLGTVKSRLHYATKTLRAAIVADSQVDPTEARLA